MTHSISGNIIVHGKFSESDQRSANHLVTDFLIAELFHEKYSTEYYSHTGFGETGYIRYSKDDPKYGKIQPFISMLDKPRSLFRFKGNLERSSPFKKKLSLFAYVESSSHVSVNDTEAAKEIYDVSMNFYNLLKKYIPVKARLELLFDNEHKLFLPSNFKNLIKEHKN